MNTLKAYKKNLKIDYSDEAQMWDAYMLDRSRDIHEKLVEKYLPLVFKEVERLSIRVHQNMDSNDLIGSGVIGLHGAISSFQPSKGYKFSTYANLKIKGALLDELRKQDHLTRNQRKTYKKICETIHKLSTSLGRCPTMDEISKNMGIKECEVSQFIGMASNALSLDTKNNQGVSYSEVIEDKGDSTPWEAADKQLSLESMRHAFKYLPERDQQLLYLRHYKDLRVKEIAQVMEISEGRVSQMYKEILVKMRSIMKLE
ncbi:MAG: FliA/WhiG family RNA polymerase sigma factor [Lentisphaeraceae bacterium]|nr:FliA/WhiG family RNA polymerase sigma factor [Lentisphaeraceae bacterium]